MRSWYKVRWSVDLDGCARKQNALYIRAEQTRRPKAESERGVKGARKRARMPVTRKTRKSGSRRHPRHYAHYMPKQRQNHGFFAPQRHVQCEHTPYRRKSCNQTSEHAMPCTCIQTRKRVRVHVCVYASMSVCVCAGVCAYANHKHRRMKHLSSQQDVRPIYAYLYRSLPIYTYLYLYLYLSITIYTYLPNRIRGRASPDDHVNVIHPLEHLHLLRVHAHA